MSRPEDASPAEVLRAKRLEIVDDEGKVGAALGTDEKGNTTLSLFDASGRLRASLDAEEIPGQASGLGVFDTNGKLRAAVGMDNDPDKRSFFDLYDIDGKPRVQLGLDNDPDKGSFLTFFDTDGKPRTVVNVHPGGQAGLSISAGKKDRAIKMAAMDGGELYLVLSHERTPMVGLRLADVESKGLSSDLALTDKDGRSGVAISGGSRFGPSVKLLDRREKVRGSFELGTSGQPRLYVADDAGKPIVRRSAFERVVAERGLVYQALLFGSVLVLGGIVGGWIAATASAAPFSLPAALITAVVLAVLVGWLIVARRRGR